MQKDNRTEYLKVRLTKEEYDGLKRVVEAEETTISALVQQKVRELAAQPDVSGPYEWV